MRKLGLTTANLARYRRQWEDLLQSGSPGPEHAAPPPTDRLVEVTGFGANPGNLRMFAHVPDRLAPSPALVVVLHGCTQTAAAYDHGAGWSTLADRYGFAVLAPEQQRANNPNACFTWFLPGDTQCDRGEALSIRQMVERMVVDHGIDRSRIFVTGLSAGGAMASAMLATYPDVFAGGAIVAGLPYGSASNVQEAFESMFHGHARPAREWGDLVRAASSHRGPWPRVSVWHGSADTTVVPANAAEIVKQWTDLHGLAADASATEEVDGHPRRVWRGPDGDVLVEEYVIAGMAHGTPLDMRPGADVPHGAAGPFLLDVGIASSRHIAAFWGLTKESGARATNEPELATRGPYVQGGLGRARAAEREPDRPRGSRRETRPIPYPDVKALITSALKVAGLMKE